MANRRKGERSFSPADVLQGVRGLGARLGGIAARLGRSGGNRRKGRAAAPVAAARQAAASTTRAPGRGWVHAVMALALWGTPIVVAVAAFATPLLGVKAYEYVMNTGYFHVREVRVDGNRRLDFETIRELAGIVPGTHALAADLEVMATRLQQHPWVRRAEVTRELPDKLVVELVERTPVAYAALGELWLIDEFGEPFARPEPTDQLDLPIITGLGLDAFADHEREAAAKHDVRVALNVLALYRSMGLADRWPVAEARVDELRGVMLVLSETGTEVIVGRGPYGDKLLRLEWVLESLHQRGKTAEYVVLDRGGVSGGGAGVAGAIDDGRVIVKANVLTSREQMMELAAERARAAERQALGLPPDPDIFGPVLPPGDAGEEPAGDAGAPGAGIDAEDERLPTLSGGRPAVPSADVGLDGELEDLLDGEE